MQIKPNNIAAWQIALAQVITDPQELCAQLNLTLEQVLPADLTPSFTLRVPRSFVARMEKGNPADPLLRQIWPLSQELQTVAGYTLHPLQEQAASPLPGLLHKYHGRVLVIVTGGCAVHCRYCFRRHFPYAENALDETAWTDIYDYIAADASIQEVIFSGGDPLLVKDKLLAQHVQRLAQIPHVQIVRLHTRLPIVIPERITEALLTCLSDSRLRPVIVVHANHANEINHEVMQALLRLKQAQVTLLNQTVLLKGVNDEVATLVQLSEKLFTAGVLPYYLHFLDQVQGTAHFAVAKAQAKHLWQGLLTRLPGYLVPKLVQEIPGALSKTPMD